MITTCQYYKTSDGVLYSLHEKALRHNQEVFEARLRNSLHYVWGSISSKLWEVLVNLAYEHKVTLVEALTKVDTLELEYRFQCSDGTEFPTMQQAEDHEAELPPSERSSLGFFLRRADLTDNQIALVTAALREHKEEVQVILGLDKK